MTVLCTPRAASFLIGPAFRGTTPGYCFAVPLLRRATACAASVYRCRCFNARATAAAAGAPSSARALALHSGSPSLQSAHLSSSSLLPSATTTPSRLPSPAARTLRTYALARHRGTLSPIPRSALARSNSPNVFCTPQRLARACPYFGTAGGRVRLCCLHPCGEHSASELRGRRHSSAAFCTLRRLARTCTYFRAAGGRVRLCCMYPCGEHWASVHRSRQLAGRPHRVTTRARRRSRGRHLAGCPSVSALLLCARPSCSLLGVACGVLHWLSAC